MPSATHTHRSRRRRQRYDEHTAHTAGDHPPIDHEPAQQTGERRRALLIAVILPTQYGPPDPGSVDAATIALPVTTPRMARRWGIRNPDAHSPHSTTSGTPHPAHPRGSTTPTNAPTTRRTARRRARRRSIPSGPSSTDQSSATPSFTTLQSTKSESAKSESARPSSARPESPRPLSARASSVESR